MDDISDEAQNLFSHYLSCWNDRDLDGVAACFDEPSMFILPTGAVALPDRSALVGLLEKVFDGLEQAGFSHTTIGAVEAQLCGDGMAIVDAKDVKRIKKDGSVLETIDGHYVARKTQEGWRFTVAVSCTNGWQTG